MNQSADDHLYYLPHIPDIDLAIFWNQTRFDRIREVFVSLLNRTAGDLFPRFHDLRDRDLSNSRGKVEFLCDCFEKVTWFATSYSSGITIDAETMIKEGENEVKTQKIVDDLDMFPISFLYFIQIMCMQRSVIIEPKRKKKRRKMIMMRKMMRMKKKKKRKELRGQKCSNRGLQSVRGFILKGTICVK